MTDDRNRSWPGQEPDAPRRAQWPEEDPGPAWPGEEAPRRPRTPPTPPRGNGAPRRAPANGGGPAWPSGDEPGAESPGPRASNPRSSNTRSSNTQGAANPQWPSDDDGPRRRPPQRPPAPPDGRTPSGMPPRRQPPPPPGNRPPGPNGQATGVNGQGPGPNGRTQGFRQPPPPGQGPGGPGPNGQGPGGPSGPHRRPSSRPAPLPPPPAFQDPAYPDREPQLITHAVHDGTDDAFGYDPYDDRYDDRYENDNRFAQYADEEDFEEEPELDEDGNPVKPPLTPQQRKKRRWKIIRRVVYAMFGLFVVVPAIAFVITYFVVKVPSPQDVKALQNQPITFLYANNTVMGRSVPEGGDRELLKPEQVPEVVKHAVYSAEDATFETNSGFNVMAIARSAFNQVTGGTGGGSTISQQYIKQATANDAPTLTRKWTELAKSFKLNNETSKSDIITGYLNIVYFGRGANGVAAAAKAYYGKDIGQLNPSEAALLAGLIQGPSRSEDQTYAKKRWTYVLDQMVQNHWLSPADRAAATFPTLVPKNSQKQKDAGTLDYHIQQRILGELEAKGYDEDKLYSSGAKIYTTIDPDAQKMAVQSVQDNMQGQTDPDLLGALVAVDPRTGGVVAYYGGPTTVKDDNGKDQVGTDWANTPQNPGSSMKPYDLTAFLKMGKGLGETFDGTNYRQLGGRTVRNAGESSSCGSVCTVKKAMEVSANTVFYDMVLNVTHPAPVAEAAKEAGIQTAPAGKAKLGIADANIALGGGATAVTPEDQAAGYSSFASGGVRHQQHFVAKLTNSQDEVEFDASTDPGKPAFDPDAQKSQQIAGNVTDALGPVIKEAKLQCPATHECAGKTGTQQYDPTGKNVPKSYNDRNAQTWMVGYTPSISVAVWVGGDGNKPLHDKNNKPIFGATVAGPTWQDFITGYLKGKPAEKFDKVKPIGKDANTVVTTTRQTSAPPTTTSVPETSEAPPTSSSEAPPSSSKSETTSPTRPTLFGGGGGNPEPPGLGAGGKPPRDPTG
ncbi:transglycosylase domain-containing protein [Amycolatopsis sp. PS_44_ISF1]|uniref:transglycosylase domain-containing protein n=1 Tax=Amycolatopsis sp. PS_44_ISF1 TaxID=2974917 RepID=UPI0028DD84D1|nr:transglycosylase domain-containing protein [Amycolatopsis sp. PS_44_ISF1]MDT8910504.1 penicillin-binding protein [Amycolatopsis sp. PS_44_ISF1]